MDPSVIQPGEEAPFEPPKPATDDRERGRLRRLRIMLPFLFLLAFLAWTFTTNYIPSESMTPTLEPGDHILTMRAWIAYPNGRTPARGDIITFTPPEAATAQELASGLPQPKSVRPEVWIKRVVALPGETVWVLNGRVYVNGSPIPHTFYAGAPNASFWHYPYASLAPLRLADDEVFVLGDNPDDSEDSRMWGPLKRDLIVGKFIRVLFREGPNGPNHRRVEAARE